MRLEQLAIDLLRPAADNARVHPPEQIAKLVDSIREFGFANPVLVDDDNEILAGHGRVEAARAAGLAEVSCVRISGLSADERRAYRVADNRIAGLSAFDPSTLADELSDLAGEGVDPALLGFSPFDMMRLEEDVARDRLAALGEPEGEAEPTFGERRLSSTSRETTRLEMLIPAVDRQVVYDALVKARVQFQKDNSGDALAALIVFVDSHN